MATDRSGMLVCTCEAVRRLLAQVHVYVFVPTKASISIHIHMKEGCQAGRQADRQLATCLYSYWFGNFVHEITYKIP